MTHSFRAKAKHLIQNKELIIKNDPSSFMNKLLGSKRKVTVVTAAFNAEQFLHKTIESVISQTIGFEQIQYIIIDDCSTDSTGKIMNEYATKYKNICTVSLHENTGSPGTPRNIGIELANTEFITFLDADDWFTPNGIEALSEILEETNDDYVVGKTIRVEAKGESVVGEFASVKERRSISPFDIPHFFYHMGPTARMMRLSLLKENELGFPEMKFAEDKLFFFDVFLEAKYISTTTKPIYYINRTDENQGSLTRTLNILDKRKADLKVIHYIKSKQLPIDKEKVILNRLYEYDFVRSLDTQTFIQSEQKDEFFSILQQAIETTKDLRYDFIEEFKTPLYKAAVELMMENRTEDVIKLFTWSKKDKNKKYVIKDQLPYYEVPFLEGKFKYIRLNMFARALDSYIIDDIFHQNVEVFGDDLNHLNHVLIRDRSHVGNDLLIDFELTGNLLQYEVKLKELNKLGTSLFTVFLRHNDYQLLNIKRILKNQIVYENKTVEFYTTIANNLGISIKPRSK